MQKNNNRLTKVAVDGVYNNHKDSTFCLNMGYFDVTNNVPLDITITTSDKFPLMQIAEELKEMWEDIGVNVIINEVSLSKLQTEVLADRNFETLLFVE